MKRSLLRSMLQFLSLALSLAAIAGCAPQQNQLLPDSEKLQREFSKRDKALFLNPEKVHYPETWFHYIGSNVSLEGITADLEAIAEAGITGIHLFHGQFGSKWPATDEGITCLSEKWDDAVRYTAEECKRLGLSFTMQNCPGWAMSGGPWIKPENAMRDLVYSRSDAVAAADGAVELALPVGQPSQEEWRDYRDIAVLAFPTPYDDDNQHLSPTSAKGSEGYDWKRLMVERRGHISLSPATEGEPYWVELSLAKPATLRSITIQPVESFNHNMCYTPSVHFTAYAILRNGKHERLVDADLPQSGWQDGRNLTFACPEVEGATKVRIEITNKYDITLRPITLSTAARKNSWESEAGWNIRSKELSGDDVIQSKECYIAANSIIDISDKMDSQGHLRWSAPSKGSWTILRIGHVNKGKKNAPAPPEGTGWECDKLSTEGPEAHYAGYIGRLNNGALQGGLLQSMLLDSWECNTQTWTMKMEEEFSSTTGYELRKWLPSLFGYVIDCPEQTTRFLLDWRYTVGNLFANKFYRRMTELGHEEGLLVRYETAAGDVFPADIMEYFKYADIPMCEFWQPFTVGYVGDIEFKPIKPTASAARLYGKARVAAESFTSFSLTWDEHFEMLKQVNDFNMIEGVTHNVFHTYTHNPQIGFLQPGTSFGGRIGTPFLRGQTWWRHMKEFTTYLARCSYMLERGKPISSVLWYLGDEIDHKPAQGYPFPEGYKYDYCNPDVLLNRLSVVDGKILSPEGQSYELLWIPQNKRMRPETLERLLSLIEQGATVVGNAPKSLATLSGGEESQKRFDKAVAAIWGGAEAGKATPIGKGKVLAGVGIEQALKMLSIEKDVVGEVRWLHRGTEGADWYFVTPLKGQSFSGEVSFRTSGYAEIWDPVTGSTTPIATTQNGEYTTLRLDMESSGSCFVLFDHSRKPQQIEPKAEPQHELALNNWSITFPEGWGAPAKVETRELKAWKDLIDEPEGKAFSGTATYSTTFTLDKAPEKGGVILDLGRVDMVAVVKLNGKRVRTLWTPPYRMEIAEGLKSGENELVVEVTSTWFNRLVYDASLPEAERKSWTINAPSAQSQLRESGLMGPVVIRY